ncbi:hypothetical protein RHMOL_Rhmol07G0242900 [Rhododendron molle]|uniref:Uncharacterized protein n=1 Tax=Rhododendron molle TaxID=49168 RepID=A0ACC0N4L8_RHOML|nr:hypothetical protein RHMOL_Rhmol07G0242900 [Rhododendron molle]
MGVSSGRPVQGSRSTPSAASQDAVVYSSVDANNDEDDDEEGTGSEEEDEENEDNEEDSESVSSGSEPLRPVWMRDLPPDMRRG